MCVKNALARALGQEPSSPLIPAMREDRAESKQPPRPFLSTEKSLQSDTDVQYMLPEGNERWGEEKEVGCNW